MTMSLNTSNLRFDGQGRVKLSSSSVTSGKTLLDTRLFPSAYSCSFTGSGKVGADDVDVYRHLYRDIAEGRGSIKPSSLVRRGDDEHLFEGGDAVADAVQGDHAQGAHALADGDLAHLAGVGAGDDQLANFIGDGHGFDDGQSAGITGILATFAAAPAIERHAVHDARIDVQVIEHFGG